MPRTREPAQANLESLYRIFTIPEAPDSTLGRIDQAISDNLTGFLQEHIVAIERDLVEIERDFSESLIPEEPTFVSSYTEFLKDKLVSQSVHTASPGFIGHMTFNLPAVRAITEAANTPSRRTLERAGFVHAKDTVTVFQGTQKTVSHYSWRRPSEPASGA